MNAIQVGEVVLESLHLVKLSGHGGEKASHAFDAGPFELVGLGTVFVVVSVLFVGQSQSPNAQSGVNVVTDPSMAIVVFGHQSRVWILQRAYGSNYYVNKQLTLSDSRDSRETQERK